MFVYGCVHMCIGTPRDQKCWIPLEQKLQRVVICPTLVLGTGFGFFGSAANTVNHQALSPFLSLYVCMCTCVCTCMFLWWRVQA